MPESRLNPEKHKIYVLMHTLVDASYVYTAQERQLDILELWGYNVERTYERDDEMPGSITPAFQDVEIKTGKIVCNWVGYTSAGQVVACQFLYGVYPEEKPCLKS